MKIVEFGEDGKPRLLKQSEASVTREVIAEAASGKVRAFANDAPASVMAPGAATVGQIKIREFGHDGAEEEPRKTSVTAQGPFGAARVPQAIKIVDFDKEKGGTPIKPTTAQERPRGMKIIETD
jgi:hypothetical protein